MPQDAEKDNFDDDAEVTPKETVVAPAKPKLLSKLRADAERLGVNPADIDECETNADLRELIENERSAIRSERATSGAERPSRGEGTPPAKAALPAPEVTDAEEAWEFDRDFDELADPVIKSEVQKLGKLVKKLGKGGYDKALQDKIDALNAKFERMESRSHPLVRRANAHVAKYASLFGTDFDEDGRPPEGTDERTRFETMMNYIFAPNAQGKNRTTGKPENDIDAAVKALFPGHELSAPNSPAAVKAGKNGTNRIAGWADSGQAPTTSRNGADRSGTPGGKDAAVRKVAAKMKEQGLDPGDLDDDDDNEV